MPLDYINRKTARDTNFTAKFFDNIFGVWAPSLAAARQKAVEHLRLKKKDMEFLQILEGHHAHIP